MPQLAAERLARPPPMSEHERHQALFKERQMLAGWLLPLDGDAFLVTRLIASGLSRDKLLELVEGGRVKTAGYISDVVRGLGRVAVLNRACYGSSAPSA